jgi:hypothetical protein
MKIHKNYTVHCMTTSKTDDPTVNLQSATPFTEMISKIKCPRFEALCEILLYWGNASTA